MDFITHWSAADIKFKLEYFFSPNFSWSDGLSVLSYLISRGLITAQKASVIIAKKSEKETNGCLLDEIEGGTRESYTQFIFACKLTDQTEIVKMLQDEGVV